MGKEQELLEAARSGNYAMVEKILSYRSKKSGPLASLRRCPGPNTTDSCGYTCLHHAALNGHKDIVELLLTHDANPNIVDNKGSTALHLAAWTGDYEIVNMLLTQSTHVPNVNLKNNDMETALHCSAQYGHTAVVSLLLQKGADPLCRNVKDESALDLAAQYGRTDTVELFLRTRPGLVRNLTIKHSPLHLSARNGHKNVVKLLIDTKFDVNYCTETGSALHEAALFGKIEVVKLLLKSGIDIELEDCQKRTVLDLLNDLHTSIAKQTKKLIREHNTIVTNDLDDSSTLMSDSSSHCISPPPGYTDNTPEHHYTDQTLTDGLVSPAMTSASEFSFYETPPARNSVRSSTGSDDFKSFKPRLSRSRDSILDGQSTSSSRSPSYLDYDIPPPLPPRHFSNTHPIETNTNNLYESPPIPIAISCSPDDYTLLRRHNQLNSYELEIRPESQSSITSSQSGYGRTTGDKPVPPVKPPRKSISPVNRSQTINSYDYSHTADRPVHNRNGNKFIGNNDRNCDNTDQHFSTMKDTRRRLIEESDFSLLYDQIANGTAIGLTTNSLNRPAGQFVISRGQHFNSHNRTKTDNQPKYYSESFTDSFNDSTLKSNNNNTNNKTKRATVQIPMQSCDVDIGSHCNGQTTPDYEPPSPTTAINGIQAVIQPLNQNGDCNHTVDDYHNHYYSSQTDCPFLNRTSINKNPFNYFDFCTDFADNKYLPAILAIQNNALEYKKLQNGKRRSHRDIETLTEEELFAALDSSGYVRLSFRNKQLNSDNNNVIKKSVAVSTDNEIPIHLNNNYKFNNKNNNKKNIYNNYCETLKLDRSGEKENPFAGLCRGSISGYPSSVKRRDITDGRKSLRRQRNFNCDINIYSTLKRTKNKKSKSMETNSDKKALKVMKGNNSFDECLQQTSGTKSGADSSDQRCDSRISRLSASPFDETAEWAEIANIMASFGSGIGRDSSLLNSELDNSYTSYLSKDSSSTEFEEQSVEEWLSRIGLSEYANLLIVNGFDNVLYMGSNVMDDSDLLEIGLTNASHRDRILSEAKQLPKVRLLTKTDEQMSVDQWLESLKLMEYKQSFQSNGYSEMSRVRNLWEVELNTVLEINKLGHRKRILASLGERLRLIEDLGLDDLDFDKLNLNISQLSVDEGFDTCSTATTTATNPANTADINKTTDKAVDNSDKQTAHPTKPSMDETSDKCADSSQSIVHQWKHQNRELIDSSCKYTASYLGSTLVRELRGIDSTRASIQKLKTSTKGIAKIPQIILSISYTGVQFIDAESKQSVCEHEIRNIHCICQDSEDLNHFAYITKELETNNHYCHVFSAQNTDLVTEIILTLGQAFEIAYQMVLESSDKFAKDLTNKSSNITINTNETNINNSNNNNNRINTSINFNNPQNDLKPISGHNIDNNKNNQLIRKQQDTNKATTTTTDTTNGKQNNTFITTISITSSVEQKPNLKLKTTEQKQTNTNPLLNNNFNNSNNKLAKNGQSSFNSRNSEEPNSSIPLPTVVPSKTTSVSAGTAPTTIPATIQIAKVKPIPAPGKPSPPTVTKSGYRPIPSPKPSTIPKPVARAKPVPPFKPQILAKPTNK